MAASGLNAVPIPTGNVRLGLFGSCLRLPLPFVVDLSYIIINIIRLYRRSMGSCN